MPQLENLRPNNRFCFEGSKELPYAPHAVRDLILKTSDRAKIILTSITVELTNKNGGKTTCFAGLNNKDRPIVGYFNNQTTLGKYALSKTDGPLRQIDWQMPITGDPIIEVRTYTTREMFGIINNGGQLPLTEKTEVDGLRFSMIWQTQQGAVHGSLYPQPSNPHRLIN